MKTATDLLITLGDLGRNVLTKTSETDNCWSKKIEDLSPNSTLTVEVERFDPPGRDTFWTCTVGLELFYGDGDSDHGCAATASLPQVAADRAMAGINGALPRSWIVPKSIPIPASDGAP